MRFPMAFCPTHGIFEAVGTIGMQNSSGIKISGVGTACPKCRAPSEMLPGEYSSIGGNLNFIIDPSISNDALGALMKIITRLERDEITQAEAKEQAEKISPKLGGLFDVQNWSKEVKAAVCAALISTIGTVAANKVSGSSSPTVIVQPVIERVIERSIDDLKYKPKYIPIPAPRPKR